MSTPPVPAGVRTLRALCACALLCSAAVGGAPAPAPVAPDTSDAASPPGPRAQPEWARYVARNSRIPYKSDLILPAVSVVIPGFGQYLQSDLTGVFYTGAAAAGILMAVDAALRMQKDENVGNLDESLSSESWAVREFMLGTLAYQGSGFLSGYSAFRTAVPRFQEEDGEYAFLTRSESVGELMAAPFRPGNLARPSAFIPLGLLAGTVGTLVAYERGHHGGRDWTTSADDFLFTGPMAWNAGVSEEAIFRGWLYPFAYQNLGRNFWLANGLQAVVFGMAHFNPDANPVPWPQALLGFYFGWLATKNGWSLSESVFVHAWWDMILFAGQMATTYREPAARAEFRVDMPLGR
jgi:membrane protease YdiL (CAAX protease family)